MTLDDDVKTLRLSTERATGREAVEAFCETFGRAILRIDMEPLPDTQLEADLRLRAFSGFAMACGHLSPMRNRHGPELIDNDDIVLVIMERGFGVIEQNGQQIEVDEGQVVLTDNSTPATFVGHTPTEVMNLRFSRARLAPHVVNLDRMLLAPILPANQALNLLRFYASSLNDEAALATPELRRTVSKHMHDLAALAIGARADAAEMATGGVRATRLRAIKADVMTNIGDPRLSPDTVAARHEISPRYMRVLFESEGISFSEFVLNQRLQRAHHMLSDPQHMEKLISAIAFECGFSDLSHFNQTFRRRYGMTPSDVRCKARDL